MRLSVPVLALSLIAGGSAEAAEGVSLDLNKLEANGGACRVTMVVVNERPSPAEVLKADLVVFGKDGVVARRLAVDLGPVQPSKTIVKMFDVPAIGCETIGSILLNDMTACRFGSEATAAPSCLDVTTLSSRAGPRFFK